MPDQVEPSKPEPRSARGRVRRVLRPYLSRGQVVVGVLLAVVGFLAVVQVRSQNDTDEDFAGARREDLLQLLDNLDSAAARAEAEIQNLQARRDELRGTTDRRTAALEEAQRQVKLLGLLSGALPAEGRGIEVTINDPSGAVGVDTLINALEELRNAGAEAIQINGRVRIVAQSRLEDLDSGIMIDDVELRPPYVIDAIGDPYTLGRAMLIPGGMKEDVEAVQGTVQIDQVTDTDLQIDALYSSPEQEYASPADETDN
ncbi:MAG: DUF881 domain-containing protein [Propionibacteriales bacterium]|nr:DUF881 domain-containing protein [Propionibacteriales bacterium]